MPPSGGRTRRATATPTATACRCAWPQRLNLQEGDFWSGSPYLGDSGVLNPGILTKTQCGEYYHVAHSHDLTQATNYGITFGGMLTLIKVEPPKAARALESATSSSRFATDGDGNDERETIQTTPASRREGTVMGIKRNRKRLVAAAIAIAGLAGGAVAAHAATFGSAVAGTPVDAAAFPAIAPTCTAQLHVSLSIAGTGSVDVADDVNGAQNVPFYGFSVNGATRCATLAGSPNSTIKVPEGTTLTITLTQAGVGDPIDLSFPSLPASDVEPRRQRLHGDGQQGRHVGVPAGHERRCTASRSRWASSAC